LAWASRAWYGRGWKLCIALRAFQKICLCFRFTVQFILVSVGPGCSLSPAPKPSPSSRRPPIHPSLCFHQTPAIEVADGPTSRLRVADRPTLSCGYLPISSPTHTLHLLLDDLGFGLLTGCNLDPPSSIVNPLPYANGRRLKPELHATHIWAEQDRNRQPALRPQTAAEQTHHAVYQVYSWLTNTKVPDSAESIFLARPAPTTRPSARASNRQNSAVTDPVSPAGATAAASAVAAVAAVATAGPPLPGVRLRSSL
jgi:hypothetical protein